LHEIEKIFIEHLPLQGWKTIYEYNRTHTHLKSYNFYVRPDAKFK